MTAANDQTVLLWDLTAEDPTASSFPLFGHESTARALAFSPDGNWLVTGSLDGTARVWDLRAEYACPSSLVLQTEISKLLIPQVALTNDRLAVGEGNDVRLFELTRDGRGPTTEHFRGHEGRIRRIRITPDERWLVTASADKTLRRWDLTASDATASSVVLRGHERRVTTITISPNSRWLVSGASGPTLFQDALRLWDLAAADPSPTSVVLHEYMENNRADLMTFSLDSRWVAIRREDGAPRFWNLSLDRTEPVDFLKDEDKVGAFAFSSDGQRLATGGWDGTVRLWDITTDLPVPLAVLKSQGAKVSSTAISPNGQWLATGHRDRTARLWKLTDEDPNSTIIRLPDLKPKLAPSVERRIEVRFSLDNRWLIVSGAAAVQLWDVTATPPRSTRPFSTNVGWDEFVFMTLTPDTRWLVTGGEDNNTARLLDLHSDDPPSNSRILRGHQSRLWHFQTSPNSRWLVTHDQMATARLWDLQLESALARAIRFAGRELTAEERKKYSLDGN